MSLAFTLGISRPPKDRLLGRGSKHPTVQVIGNDLAAAEVPSPAIDAHLRAVDAVLAGEDAANSADCPPWPPTRPRKELEADCFSFSAPRDAAVRRH